MKDRLTSKKRNIKPLNCLNYDSGGEKLADKNDVIATSIRGRYIGFKPEPIYVLKIAGSNVYIYSDIGLCRIGHISQRVEGNLDFAVLDKKAQELIVYSLKKLLEAKRSEIDEEDAHLKSDKQAVSYMVKKYPKVPKIYWVLAYRTVFKTNHSALNYSRMKSLIKSLSLIKDYTAKEILHEISDGSPTSIGANLSYDKETPPTSFGIPSEFADESLDVSPLPSVSESKLKSAKIRVGKKVSKSKIKNKNSNGAKKR